jgi:methyl-accepting chemotaxis protein
MKHLQNILIGIRLGSAFFIVILLLILVTVLGIYGIRATNQDLNFIVKDRMVKVQLANAIDNEMNLQARAIRTAIIAVEPKVVEDELAKVAISKLATAKALDALNASVSSPEGLAALAQLKALGSAYSQNKMHSWA